MSAGAAFAALLGGFVLASALAIALYLARGRALFRQQKHALDEAQDLSRRAFTQFAEATKERTKAVEHLRSAERLDELAAARLAEADALLERAANSIAKTGISAKVDEVEPEGGDDDWDPIERKRKGDPA